MSMEHEQALAKPCKWVREFMCATCGKRHRVEGRRRDLSKLQKEKENACNYLEIKLTPTKAE